MEIVSTNENVTIWKYLDFKKLISLVDSSSLFFCRLDMLEDDFEGLSPDSQLKDLYGNLIADKSIHQSLIKQSQASEKLWKKYTAVNCWHLNQTESAAMWKIYLQSDYGIAIKSTKEKLIKCFLPREKHTIIISEVKYGNYEDIKFGNILNSNVFHKRDFFSYEQELRALIRTDISIEEFKKGLIEGKELLNEGEFINGDNIDLDKLPGLVNGGLYINVDLNILIDEIIIAPKTPTWIIELIEKIIKKYNYNFTIKKSKMN